MEYDLITVAETEPFQRKVSRLLICLLTLFDKNEKPNLSKAERNVLSKAVKVLVKNWS